MESQNVNTEGLVRGVTYDEEPEKVYLILLDGIETYSDDLHAEIEKDYRDWEIIEGRQKAYDYIKNMLETEYVTINVMTSKIIVSSEKVKVTDGISIYEFMKTMKEKDKIVDYTSFDIEDYVSHEFDDINNYTSYIQDQEGTE